MHVTKKENKRSGAIDSPYQCVRCGRGAVYSVDIIRATELPLDINTSMTLTGIKTTQRFMYGVPEIETVSACTECIRKLRYRTYAVCVLAALLLVATITFAAGFACMGLVSVFGESFGMTQQESLGPCFAVGAALSVIIMIIVLVRGRMTEERKSHHERSQQDTAVLARITLDKRDRGKGIRHFTTDEYAKMIETGKHPESE